MTEPTPIASTEYVQQTSDETNALPPNTIKGYVPPLPGIVPGPADIQNALAGWAQRELAKQAWWQKSSNTVTAAVGSIITIATFVIPLMTNAPTWVQYILPILGMIGTVIGVKNTKNGFTYQGAAKVQQAILDPAVLATVQKTLAQEPFPTHMADAAIDAAAQQARAWINQNQTNSGSQG